MPLFIFFERDSNHFELSTCHSVVQPSVASLGGIFIPSLFLAESILFCNSIVIGNSSKHNFLDSLSRETLEPLIKSLIEKHNTNFKGVGQPLRIALVGSRFGPGIYDVILSLDKSEVIKRLSKI